MRRRASHADVCTTFKLCVHDQRSAAGRESVRESSLRTTTCYAPCVYLCFPPTRTPLHSNCGTCVHKVAALSPSVHACCRRRRNRRRATRVVSSRCRCQRRRHWQRRHISVVGGALVCALRCCGFLLCRGSQQTTQYTIHTSTHAARRAAAATAAASNAKWKRKPISIYN